MEGFKPNNYQGPERVFDYQGSGYRDISKCPDTSEAVYQSVGYDSGIGLSSFKSTDTISGNLEVSFHNLNLKNENQDSFPITSDSCPVQKSHATSLSLSSSGPNTAVNDWVCDDRIWRFEEEFFKQDEEGDTCLHLAIIKPDLHRAFQMIEAAWNPERLDIQNLIYMHTPLHLAVIMNQPQVVRALVVSGASLMTRDRHGNTALHLACKQGNFECIKQLTTPPNDEEQKYITSVCATRSLPPRVIKPMMSSDIGLMNYEGETCLHLALSSGAKSTTDVIDYLVSICGADINIEEGKCGYTVLHQAVKAKDIEVVQFLLRYHQISINQLCYCGNTALDIAISLNLPQLEQILRMSGAIRTEAAEQIDDDNDGDDFDDLMIGGLQIKS